MPTFRSTAAPGAGRGNLAESLQQALFAHQNGDLVEAARLYKVILRKQPDHFDALNLLGMVEGQRGRWDKAERLISDALKRNDRIAEVWSNLGNVQHQRGRYEEAIKSFDRALDLDPGHPTALNNRGNALLALGRSEEALASLDAALTADPGFAGARHNRGVALRGLGRNAEALEDFDKALALAPGAGPFHADRASTLVALGRMPEALAAFERAVALDPRNVDALYNRGVALLRQLQIDDALASFEQVLAIDPSHAASYSNRGTALVQLGRIDEALESFDRALHQDSSLLVALTEKGTAALSNGRDEAAADAFERLVARDSDYPYALGNLLYARAFCCEWSTFSVLRSLVMQGVESGQPSVLPGHFLALTDSPALRLRATQAWVREQNLPAEAGVRSPSIRRRSSDRHEKIRLAYVSGNFNDHPMPMLLAGLFEQHDRSRFETTAISLGVDDGSAMRQRMTQAFDHFIDVRAMPDEAVAGLLESRETDIVVDLMGFTQGGRPGIFLLRPADIQVSYMGYCGTTALDCIDYVIADRCVIPDDDRQFYTEKVVHLPDSYFGNDNTRVIAGHMPTRLEAGLPESGFVFCCFNNHYKITPEIFAGWMRLLASVEGSALWLLEPNATAQRNLRQAAKEHGVSPDRIVFAGRVSPAEHLARHRLADLVLDTLPYNAHTTACDALWAGVPVLTRMGDAFPGRVAASVLNAAGLPELITSSESEYEALALRLAREPETLAGLRRKIAAQRDRCPLFDTDRFRRHIEAAYTTMYERHRRGEPPESFAVEPVSPAPVSPR